MRKIIITGAIVIATITTTWSASIFSQPRLGSASDIVVSGGGGGMPIRMTPLW
jgi:hypothetical protein